MFEDREGNVWAGSDSGLFRVRRRSITTFTREDGLADNNTYSIAQGTDQTMCRGRDKRRVVPTFVGKGYK